MVPTIKKIGFSMTTVKHIPRINQATHVFGFLSDSVLKMLDMVIFSFAATVLL
jgi:hypothetical protein